MGEIKLVLLTHKIGDALVNIDQRDLIPETTEKPTGEGRKDEKTELLGKHNGIWDEG
jgi:hypothetical protein